ncbi:MAG: anion permease [Candidatus Fermentithermobacillus carboniphilus]|uniref:Sodium-dependent dicarboxylate transporter SdcS n=1 Tax=Candidatus Fermentithermobacillus carboniphilus TaxID=3085328 RepID=A0AAT9LHA8_9FIRM|nr:MAG: anion permease [Candidatus Fermentithermobacillus carboniphilus]
MGSQTAAPKSANTKKIIWAVVGIVLALGIGFANPPEGLTKGAMWNLGLLAWAVVYWATGVFPDYVTAIIMVLIWMIGLKVPANIALGAFSGSTQWLLMSALVFATALIKTGLVRRISLWLLKILPPTYRGQVLGTLLAGIVLGPVVPNGIAKVTMLGPVAMEMADQSGYGPRSPGMNGLTLAVWAGCVPVATLAFMTGGAPNLAIFAALPQAIKNEISWSGWLLAALPLAVLVTVVLYLSLITMYKPESSRVSAEKVQTELSKMGPMSVQEKRTAVVLALALLLWMTGNIHKYRYCLGRLKWGGCLVRVECGRPHEFQEWRRLGALGLCRHNQLDRIGYAVL